MEGEHLSMHSQTHTFFFSDVIYLRMFGGDERDHLSSERREPSRLSRDTVGERTHEMTQRLFLLDPLPFLVGSEERD